ncbi:putative 4-hydroxy-4-methyl-2-oxoglutarate aldolase [Shewanella abyssi]|uniref:putative 4-hydroxy-4-methyl-2-oxoglutarate aldolase n=1 Tax=Shewanella abyssi TaxID=311789 RepID=UPI00200E5C6D|nr:putative 4-hydroxy-4-methyl-2-oxoglutarate aldolase [Shewanella abyssi]MCL1048141.1 putative 4-hydroxy-4-methyl-2-oxoglutarate aldolase [Shewanella abyssi]
MLDLLPDLFDSYAEHLSLLPPMFKSFGNKDCFWGEVVTVKCFKDNSLVKDVLAKDGKGKVLVVDGQGMTDSALLGDMIAKNAEENGWQGIVIFGCVRDVAALKTMDIGIQAIGVSPVKTVKKGLGEVNVAVEIYGVIISPHSFVYADLNGIAISNQALDLSVLN